MVTRNFEIVKQGVMDTAAKLRRDPKVTMVNLTGSGKELLRERGIDGDEGEVLSYLDEHIGGRTIRQIASDLHMPVLTVQRITTKYSRMNPPYVQVN